MKSHPASGAKLGERSQWRSKYGGMEASDVKRLKELQFENEKLKRMYAEMALENRAIKELLGKL